MIAVLSAITGAFSFIGIRKVSCNFHYSVGGFYWNMGNIIICPLYSLFYKPQVFATYDLKLVGILIALGLSSYVNQISCNHSFKYVTAQMAGVIVYICIPTGYLLDYLFLGQDFGKLEIVGAALIVVVNVLLGGLKIKGVIK